MQNKTPAVPSVVKQSTWKRFVRQRHFHFFMIVMALWCFAMQVLPIFGNIIAFQNFRITRGFFNSIWVGLRHFKSFLTNPYTATLVRNTLAMSTLGLVFGTLASVLLALLLNEIRHSVFKRTVQTISYLPHFLSMAVVASLFTQILARSGPINEFLISSGLSQEVIPFLEKEEMFWTIITIQSVWKSAGYGAIVYIAAITGISSELYEAAAIDGAGRFRRLWSITLPSIIPTIIVVFILNSANLVKGGFEQQLLMYNPMVMDHAEVINTYVYKRGVGAADYSFATAIGMLQSILSLILLVVVNKVSGHLTQVSLW